MNFWIADFFNSGHSLKEIYNMTMDEYNDITHSLGERRAVSLKSGNSRNLRPIQKNAISKAKELNKK